MEQISSKENKRIKTIKKLISSASFRREEKRFTAEALPKDGRIVTTDELGDAVANEI